MYMDIYFMTSLCFFIITVYRVVQIGHAGLETLFTFRDTGPKTKAKIQSENDKQKDDFYDKN